MKQLEKPDLDTDLKLLIQSIYEEHQGRYGYRRIRDELFNRGHQVNHKKVQRIMKELGLKSVVRIKKYRSYKGTVDKIAPKTYWIVTFKQKNQMRNGLPILRN